MANRWFNRDKLIYKLIENTRYFHVVDGPIVMLLLTTPGLQCPRLCLMELIYSLWRIPCISMGSGMPILTMNVLSIKLDGIAPFISSVLSESL